MSLTERLSASLLSGVVKNVVDAGHLWYFARRLRFDMMLRRFDWFAGLTDDVVRGERAKFAKRWAIWGFAFWFLL